MAALQKTWSGDLTVKIAGEILNAIKNYDDEDGNKEEASTSVKQAAKNLDKDDGSTKVNSSSIVVKDTILPVHIKVVTLGKETKKLSGKVTAIGTGLADTQKLIGTQNEMLEQKFDTILALLSGGVGGGGEGGTLGSGGASGTGGVQKVSANAGDRLSAFFGKKFMMRGARALLRRGSKMLPKGIKRNLLRFRNAPRRVGKKVLRKAVTKFATSGVGKKIGTKIGAKAITKGVGKGVGKSLAKKVPILGAVMGAAFAVDRLRKGDFLGAGLELASGVASIFPGLGTGISVGIDAALIARDVAGEGGKNQQSNVQSNSSQGGSRTISGYEKGSGGTNIMGFFKQAGSLLVSSVLPVAAATGTLSEVQSQITDAGLDYPIAPLPPIPVNIGQGKIETPAQVESKTHSKIPGFGGRKKEETETPPSDDRNIFQKSGDWIKEKASGAWNWLKEGTQSNVKKIQSFVSTTAEKVNNSKAVNKVRDVIGSEKGDGYIGPKWMNIKNPFVKSETPVTGDKKETVSGNMTPDQRQALDILAKYESSAWGYNAVNQYGASEGRENSWTNPETGEKSFVGDFSNMEQHGGRSLTDLTVAEVLALQADDGSMSMEKWVNSGKLHAVGRYQFVGNTLPGLVERSGISPDLKFDKRTQDILALQLLSERGIQPWVGPSDKATPDEKAVIKRAQKQPVPSYEKGGILTSPPPNVAMKSQQVQHASASIDEIEDQAPAQPIVYLTNMDVSSTPLVMPKSSSRKDDFVSRYRFMSLGAA